jgi:arylsulfatase A-like enzyme
MHPLRNTAIGVGLIAVLAGGWWAWTKANQPHNVIIFVADGLRSEMVTDETAPALAAVRAEGVDFANSHSIYPTLTTVNASAIATGHFPADNGDFGNVIGLDQALPSPFLTRVAPIEDNAVLRLLNKRFGGNYLSETSVMAAARAKGYQTAVVGKDGPAAIQDITAVDGGGIIVDDTFGIEASDPTYAIKNPPDLVQAIKDAGLGKAAPDRGLNAWPGNMLMPGVHVANTVQQDWMTKVATQVVLPRFKKAGKPFFMVFWSRDPDGTQHNQGDSLQTLTPGINGPTSLAAIKNASNDLQRLRDALKALGLDKTTDIIVTADHGFSTINRQSATSAAAKMSFRDTPKGMLPPGFLAIDIAQALGKKLFLANGLEAELKNGLALKGGSAVIGDDPAHPDVVVAANGGSDLIYLPSNDKALAARIVALLTTEDYTGAIFAADRFGPIPGALPTSKVHMGGGTALTLPPSIVVAFRSEAIDCARVKPELCSTDRADTDLQQGQGMHGAFGRGDTHNFMAAVGPDFKKGFKDPSPVSNADLGITVAKLLGLDLHAKGKAMGRVLGEALVKDGKPVPATARVERSSPAANGFVTVLNAQDAGGAPYFDAAGAPGRTLGLKP